MPKKSLNAPTVHRSFTEPSILVFIHLYSFYDRYFPRTSLPRSPGRTRQFVALVQGTFSTFLGAGGGEDREPRTPQLTRCCFHSISGSRTFDQSLNQSVAMSLPNTGLDINPWKKPGRPSPCMIMRLGHICRTRYEFAMRTSARSLIDKAPIFEIFTVHGLRPGAEILRIRFSMSESLRAGRRNFDGVPLVNPTTIPKSQTRL